MVSLYSHEFPAQFHGYFASREQYFKLYGQSLSSINGVLLEFTYSEGYSQHAISSHMMRMFGYHSASYFLDDKYWETHFEGINQIVVRSNVAQPILKLLVENFDEVSKHLEEIVSSGDFFTLPRYKQGESLAQTIGLVLDQKYIVKPDVAIGIAVAMLVMLIPCIDEDKVKTIKNIKALIT